MEQNAKYIKMTTEPIEKLIAKLAVPTIISMLVTSFYNLADTLFVRQLENDSMVAAVGIVMPLMSIIQACGFFCGHGSANYISRAFGRQDYKSAEKMAATGFGFAFLIGIFISVFGLLFRVPLVTVLGAKTAATMRESINYMFYILLATPFMMGAIVINNQLRMQGNAFFSMIGLTSGAILNIILDPILIFEKGAVIFGGAITMPFGFGMGVGGAALATAASQIVSFVLLAIGMWRSDNVKIHLKNFTPNKYYIGGIVQGGLPSLARQGLGSIATTCLNNSIGAFVAPAMIDAAQAAMTGTSRIMMFLYSAIIGFGQGFQPVCGFNYGAKKYDRVIKAYYFCIKVSFVVLVALSTLGTVFAGPITDAVAGSSAEAAEIAKFALRAQLVVFPLMAWVTMSNMMLQNIGKTVGATLVAMLRQGIAFIPAVLLMPLAMRALGFEALLGIQLSQTVADVISFLVSVPIGQAAINEMKKELSE
ncbi:MAG: MATE family efflux transporter [Clostridia bacterium]|nr:MATE family efflux transporter [Clostridia bacterium]